MTPYNTNVVTPACTKRFNSRITKDTELEIEGDEEEEWEIEQSEINRCEKQEEIPPNEWLDVLCLETACGGVLLTLWCELTTYAELYGVPRHVLRAMVQCSFLAELDKTSCWTDFVEDPKPLTREQYIRALKRAQATEDSRVHNVLYPYKVPEEKWKEMLAKANAGRSTAP